MKISEMLEKIKSFTESDYSIDFELLGGSIDIKIFKHNPESETGVKWNCINQITQENESETFEDMLKELIETIDKIKKGD